MILAYLRERLSLAFFGPLAVMLAISAIGRPRTPAELAVAIVGAGLLLAQFRIWDDIADRDADAIAHPQRTLVRAESWAPLAGLAVALLIVSLALVMRHDGTVIPLLLLIALHIGLGIYYLLRRSRTVLGDQLVLAKYPAFVVILAGERVVSAPVPVALAAAAIYAAASAYEAWHDPVSPLAQFLGGRS